MSFEGDKLGMGSESMTEASPEPKLSLFSLPSQPSEPAGMLTPPLHPLVSVPFQWEEAPGKPRHCSSRTEPKAKCARSLELPPRLQTEAAKITNMPSPTTVLDGPDVCRTLSFSFRVRSPDSLGSKRVTKESCRGGGGFGSMRWGSFRKNKEVVHQGSFDSLPTDGGGGGGGGASDTKVKITRVRRRASFLSITQTKSPLWASICESFKQVVPWRRRQEKMRKMAS